VKDHLPILNFNFPCLKFLAVQREDYLIVRFDLYYHIKY